MSKTTEGGTSFDYFEPDEMPERPAFVVLRISGEYSGILWSVVAVTESLDDAMRWMDANPIEQDSRLPDCYEVHVSTLHAPEEDPHD